jgi:hypothetical protein
MTRPRKPTHPPTSNTAAPSKRHPGTKTLPPAPPEATGEQRIDLLAPIIIPGPATRKAFFHVGAAYYVNLFYNAGRRLKFNLADLHHLFDATPTANLVLGRRLSPDELNRLLQLRYDSDADAASQILPEPPLRWTLPQPYP